MVRVKREKLVIMKLKVETVGVLRGCLLVGWARRWLVAREVCKGPCVGRIYRPEKRKQRDANRRSQKEC